MDDKIDYISEKSTRESVGKFIGDPVYEEITSKDSKLKCAVIGEGWPSWLSGVLSLKITPSVIKARTEIY